MSPILRLCNYLTTKDIEVSIPICRPCNESHTRPFQAHIAVDGCQPAVYKAPPAAKTVLQSSDESKPENTAAKKERDGQKEVKLSDIAFARSGDKGNAANIGKDCRFSLLVSEAGVSCS